MFEARLLDGSTFKQIIDSIKDFVTDANVNAAEDALRIQCMDSSHVALVDVQLQADAFDHFRCDKPLCLGIKPPSIAKILKLMNKDDIMVLKAEEGGDILTMMFEAKLDSKTIADFEIKLMDIDTEELAIPDIAYRCSVKMPSAEFARIIRDLGVLGDTCTIGCTKEGARFSVTGEIGTGNVLIRANSTPAKEEEHVVIDMEEPVELSFSLRYINFFTKATPLSSSVIICMSPEVPMMIEYPIGESGHVKFFLAPKMEEDGDDGADQ